MRRIHKTAKRGYENLRLRENMWRWGIMMERMEEKEERDPARA